MHSIIDPAILYFGPPVVLVSSTNPDGPVNLAPMSTERDPGEATGGPDDDHPFSATLLRETGIAFLAAPVPPQHPSMPMARNASAAYSTRPGSASAP